MKTKDYLMYIIFFIFFYLCIKDIVIRTRDSDLGENKNDGR